MGHLFDVHAAFGRGDDGDAAGLAVDQQREVEFLRDVDAVGDVEALDLLALRAGLDGDQGLAEHFLGMGADFLDRLGEPDAALGVGASSLNLPLPRPPAWICAFTTQSGPGSFFAASTASSTVIAAWPAGTGTPNFASSSLA